jgi:hypothetical protein
MTVDLEFKIISTNIDIKEIPIKRKKRKYIGVNSVRALAIKNNEMLKSQNYVCAICKNPETVKSVKGKLKELAVDHCHNTGKIRGLLCYACNIGIGLFKNNPEILYQASLYCE